MTETDASKPPKSGCRPWLPPALLVASAVAADTVMTIAVLVVPAMRDQGRHGVAVMNVMEAMFGFVAAGLLVVGAVLAFRWSAAEKPTFVGWYTGVLLVLSVFGAFPLLLFEWMIRRAATSAPPSPVPAFRFVQAVVAAYSIALLVGVVLRALRSRLAAAWTTCIAVCLLLYFPFGTAVGVTWLAAVRGRETSPS